jgi:hypothetical protein
MAKGRAEVAKVKNVEKKIWDVEGFDVRFRQNGKDVRGDKENIPQYPGKRKSKGDMTVSEWKTKKFSAIYPGYEVAVYDGNGNIVRSGQLKLENLRLTYQEEKNA